MNTTLDSMHPSWAGRFLSVLICSTLAPRKDYIPLGTVAALKIVKTATSVIRNKRCQEVDLEWGTPCFSSGLPLRRVECSRV